MHSKFSVCDYTAVFTSGYVSALTCFSNSTVLVLALCVYANVMKDGVKKDVDDCYFIGSLNPFHPLSFIQSWQW